MSNNFSFTMTDTEIFKMIKNIISYPLPQICVHSVACDLLSLLEEKGYKTNNNFENLCRTVTRAEDTKSLKILNNILRNTN